MYFSNIDSAQDTHFKMEIELSETAWIKKSTSIRVRVTNIIQKKEK
jgi:hypothetical protein